ncbi:MAG: hypothetical protein QME52_07245 [Bacteroidota bacterium]|nr:hypothetical protein [Bacteroidota bacterium]
MNNRIEVAITISKQMIRIIKMSTKIPVISATIPIVKKMPSLALILEIMLSSFK